MDARKHLRCSDFEELAVLYAAGELNNEERAAVESHAELCSDCAATLEIEMRLRNAIAARPAAADELDRCGFLLAQCRSELAEAIDDSTIADGKSECNKTQEMAARWQEWFSPAHWSAVLRHALVAQPIWSTAALFAVGGLVTIAGHTWYRGNSMPVPGTPAMVVSAPPRLTDRELEMMGVEDIRWKSQDGVSAPRVEVRLRSDRPLVVAGTADDSEVRRVLTYIVQHGQQFDPGVRLDSVDVLRTRTADPQVRSVLSETARRDANPAVRLKAIEALHGSLMDSSVRQAMLDALDQDDNSGVRVEALNALLASFDEESSVDVDSRALDVFRERMHKDSNNYVRSRSAAALGRLTSARRNAAGESPRP